MAADPTVTKEDQNNINLFNRLHTRVKALQAELAAKKTELEALEDASNEVMLAEDDELRFVMGQCFVHLGSSEAEERVQAAAEEATGQRDKLQEQIDKAQQEIAAVKKVLYARLGDTINLEE